MSNPAYPGDLKIGQTGKDPEERRKDLGSTGVLQDFVLEYRALSEEYESLEKEIHRSLAAQRVRSDREFFTISVPEAINKIREIAGDRIESDQVFYVPPEDLLKAQEERLKKAEVDRIAFEAKGIQMQKEIKERRLLAEAEAQKKVDRAKFKEAEDIRIKALKEDERIRVEKEKEQQKEKEELEYKKNLFRPPKKIFLFPLWFIFVPLEWSILKSEKGSKWLEVPYFFLGMTLMVTNFAILAFLLDFLLNLLGFEY